MKGMSILKRGLLAATFVTAFAFVTVGTSSEASARRHCRGGGSYYRTQYRVAPTVVVNRSYSVGYGGGGFYDGGFYGGGFYGGGFYGGGFYGGFGGHHHGGHHHGGHHHGGFGGGHGGHH